MGMWDCVMWALLLRIKGVLFFEVLETFIVGGNWYFIRSAQWSTKLLFTSFEKRRAFNATED